MILRGVGRQIVLVDKNRSRAEAEADDLLHSVPFSHPIDVHAGDYSDLQGSRLVVLAAGANQAPGETRLDLVERNVSILRQIVGSVMEHAPQAVLLLATNPVDVLTHIAADIAAQTGGDRSRVMGSGTTLDTARFRSLLGRELGIDSQHVHAYVIGEHGDSEVLNWSQVTVGGMPLKAFCEQHHLSMDEETCERIESEVRRAAYNIIEGKGATYYGIGSALARIARAVLYDERAILTVCAETISEENENSVTLSLPRLVGGAGVLKTFPPPLDEAETAALKASKQVIRQVLEQVSSAGD